MLTPRLLWIFFLGVIFCATLVYTVYTSVALYHHYRLTESVPIHTIKWSVHPVEKDDIRVKAHYQLVKDQTNYTGDFEWPEHYLNAWAAEEARARASRQMWNVWIDPSDPHYSTLQKIFPIKQCLSTLILWGISLYFVFLARYVTR